MTLPILILAGGIAGGIFGFAAWIAASGWLSHVEDGTQETSSAPFRNVIVGAAASIGAIGVFLYAGDLRSMLPLLLCGPVLLFILIVDVRARRVPVAGAVFLAAIGLVASFPGSAGLTQAVFGAAAGLVATGVLWQVGRFLPGRSGQPFGSGDVMVAVGIGAATGWPAVVAVLLWGSLAAALAAVVQIRRGGARSALPWGAYLCCAALIALLFRI